MIYFGGCSITMGAGYPAQQQDYRIYPNLVAKELGTNAVNDAEGGSSNLKIFLRACKALIDGEYDVHIIQWSAIHRHWLYPTPDTGLFIGTPMESGEDTKFIAEFQKRNHDYGNIMQLADFCRIIQEMARLKNKKVIFVNGRVSLTPDMADRNLPMNKKFYDLLSDLKKDQQEDFAERLINNFELINWQHWANPWNSISEMQTDNAPLDTHPGPETHAKLAKLILERIDT